MIANIAIIILIIAVIFPSKSSHIIIEIIVFIAEIIIKNIFFLLTAIKINIIAENINKTLVPPINIVYELTVEAMSFI